MQQLVVFFISSSYLTALLCLWKQDLYSECLEKHTHTRSCLGKSAASGSVEGRLKSSWQLALLSSLCFPPGSPPLLSPTFISHFLTRPPPHHCPMDPIYHLSSALAPPSVPPSFPSPSFFITCPLPPDTISPLSFPLTSFLPSSSSLLSFSPSSFCRVPIFYRPNDYSALHMRKQGAKCTVLLVSLCLCLFLISISFLI